MREARAAEFEVDGLRPYREGSPASRIHWPALARSGEMHERRMVAGAEATPLVVLDAELPDDQEALDRAVRAAASLCVHLAPGSGCSVLLPGSHGRRRCWTAGSVAGRRSMRGSRWSGRGADTASPARRGPAGQRLLGDRQAPGEIALPRSVAPRAPLRRQPAGPRGRSRSRSRAASARAAAGSARRAEGGGVTGRARRR